ncbi:hypothetical protein JYU34_003335 [Plutella xylostella]|uniref:Uncharacterized protein n=1 Tax=Plutella xylostella TaxID=51655 RepID=A0ABQ7QZT4_PLUXY|nr:hypothetical protein JYU34_003335 [Plutella xylostella]
MACFYANQCYVNCCPSSPVCCHHSGSREQYAHQVQPSQKPCHAPPAPPCLAASPPSQPARAYYVRPTYKCEDGRADRYVEPWQGRLPPSACRRNGIQDHIYGYRAAIRTLCTGPDCTVCTEVQPLKTYCSRITKEMSPAIKKSKKFC